MAVLDDEGLGRSIWVSDVDDGMDETAGGLVLVQAVGDKKI